MWGACGRIDANGLRLMVERLDEPGTLPIFSPSDTVFLDTSFDAFADGYWVVEGSPNT